MITFMKYLEMTGSVSQVAQEFYAYVEQTYPGLRLGIVGSGNCAWTAREFHDWAAKNGMGNAQILYFMWTDREQSAHIVPVYQGNVIDYIQDFTGGKTFVVNKVSNLGTGKLTPVEQGGLEYYKEWYDQYVLGNSIPEIEKVIGFTINTYECPAIPKAKT